MLRAAWRFASMTAILALFGAAGGCVMALEQGTGSTPPDAAAASTGTGQQGQGPQSSPTAPPDSTQPPSEAPKRPFGGGDGITFSSDDGDYSIQFGFYGQFRFSVYDV